MSSLYLGFQKGSLFQEKQHLYRLKISVTVKEQGDAQTGQFPSEEAGNTLGI